MMRALLWIAVASLVVAAGCSGKGSGESEGSSSTAGASQCVASSDCPEGQVCVRVPCDGADAPAGCGAFACNPECAAAFGDRASWTCSDDASCCGEQCGAGACLEGHTGPGETEMSASASSSTGDPSTGSSGTTTAGTTDASTGTDTDGELPPLCSKSSECPGGGNCLNKPCDVVMNAPGCGEFRCYAECSDPFTEAAFWICADQDACCGGYPCMAGMCTEEFTTG